MFIVNIWLMCLEVIKLSGFHCNLKVIDDVTGKISGSFVASVTRTEFSTENNLVGADGNGNEDASRFRKTF